jgi:hypothetical protein
MTLPLLETFVELLLWNSFQYRRHKFLCPFKAEFIFGNSQKSFGEKSGEQGGCSISVINFWATNCLTAASAL